MTERGDWVGYYDGQGEREPHDLLLQVLAMFDDDGRRGLAVDLGCGQGFESAELLRRGWEVIAIDATEEGIRRLRRRVPESDALRLRTVVSRMEDRGRSDGGSHPRELQPAVLSSFRSSRVCGVTSARRSIRAAGSPASCSATATRGHRPRRT